MMRLMVVLHKDRSTSLALAEAAHIAQTLTPDMTLVGVAGPGARRRQWLQLLRTSRRELLREMGGALLYPADEGCYRVVRDGNGVWEERPETVNGHRSLVLKLRKGLAGRQLLAELGEAGADLVMVGANGHERLWEPGYRLGMRLVRKGSCPVMVVKGQLSRPMQVVWCAHRLELSSDLRALIKALVEMYADSVDVVGVGDAAGLEHRLERCFPELGEYCASHKVKLWVEGLPSAMVEEFLKEQVRRGIVILDLSEGSAFSQLLSPGQLTRLLYKARAPVVILR